MTGRCGGTLGHSGNGRRASLIVDSNTIIACPATIARLDSTDAPHIWTSRQPAKWERLLSP